MFVSEFEAETSDAGDWTGESMRSATIGSCCSEMGIDWRPLKQEFVKDWPTEKLVDGLDRTSGMRPDVPKA